MGVQMFSCSFLLLLFFLNAMLCINVPFVLARHCVPNQKDLLLELKNNLTYNSSLSTKLTQWKESIDCCQWRGVKCDPQGRVTGLDLSNESISRGIDGNATSFIKLELLQSLNLAYNDFGGVQLPCGFGWLVGLSYLNLSYSNFSGQIPTKFSSLTRLVVLDLSSYYNSLKLENPNLKTLIHNFTKLRELYLDRVYISANGYQWCNDVSSSLPNLQVLSLSYTNITGPFDPSLAKLQSLSVINLDMNTFSSPIPIFFANFPSLRVLRLRWCNLSGSIPNSFSNLTQLTHLHLSFNQFTGRVPSFSLQKNLTFIDLSNNQFHGLVYFTDFVELPNLTYLDLSHNNLSVLINENVLVSSYLPKLRALALASCNLQKIPALQNTSSLTSLDLSNNKLYGEIPNWIWALGNGTLNTLNLSHNQLTSFQEPYDINSKIVFLDLSSNKLGGQIPILPPDLDIVDFSNNNFSSSLPTNIGNSLKFTGFFSIANNNISGTIPPSLCYAREIGYLDLSNNRFHGRIPSCLVKGTLYVLNLGRNNLDGDIPDKFAVDCGLSTLDLSSNNFQGHIPISMSRCSEMQVLNLGHNYLDDTFPCSFKNLSKLRILVLRSNKFHGNMSCMQEGNYTWPNLQIIDLASNNFNGILPWNLFQNMKALMVDVNGSQSQLDYLYHDYSVLGGSEFVNTVSYQDSVDVIVKGLDLFLDKISTIFTGIDFSNNHFEGKIPETIGELKSLYVLNFSHNALTGHIPSSVEKLHTLESLDLSANHLDGEIPQQLASLTFLSHLNLSYNKLVGRIPQGNQMATFSESMVQGNEGLCGFPLKVSCSPEVRQTKSDEEHESSGYSGIYISAELGFIVGLGVLYAPLLFSRRWRRFFGVHLNKVALFLLRRR